MIKSIKRLLLRTKTPADYGGFSDFFLNASLDEKKKVIVEAARKSNESQMNMFKKASLVKID
jgi:hypothetical protein